VWMDSLLINFCTIMACLLAALGIFACDYVIAWLAHGRACYMQVCVAHVCGCMCVGVGVGVGVGTCVVAYGWMEK